MLLIIRTKKKSSTKMAEFNKKLSAHLKKKNIPFNFSSFEDMELFLENKKINLLIDGKSLDNWKTIYPRKVGRYGGMAFILANMCKNKNIQFIDKFHEKSKASSDTAKIIQMFKFSLGNVPIPKTYYSVAYQKKHLQNAGKFLGFPIVIKQCNSSQGSGVFLAKDKKTLTVKITELMQKEAGKEIFLQEFIPNTFEYRVFVTGKEVGAVEKKIRTKKNEFRNNVFLGAREEFMSITSVRKIILNAALKASRVANIQVSGVDVVEKENGEVAIFEANSCPSLTLNEKISPELKSLSDYLEKCEKK